MTIEILSPDRLRVVLTVTDLDRYELDYSSISSDDPATRRMVCDILTKAKTENGFRFRNNKLLVEVVPGKDNGCVLYLTKSPAQHTERPEPSRPRRAHSRNAYILGCETLDDVIDAIGCFAGYPDIPLRSSALYKTQDGYSLLFRPVAAGIEKQRMAALLLELSEYGDAGQAGSIREAVLQEHGQPVAPRRAVETFMRYFS